VFEGCGALQEVMSLALTPPSAHEDEGGYMGQEYITYPGTFNGIDKDNCVLRIFESAMTDYSKAKGWRQFTHREPINESEYVPGDVNGDGVVDIADVNGVINGMLGKADIVIDVNDVKFGLAKVEGGTFNMGTDVDEEQLSWGFYDNVPSPVHQVTLDGFLISTTEVTQKLFHAVMGGTEPEYEQMNCPIYGINLNRVNSFIQRLNEATGLQFRLPTEAEWEFAARGGNKSQGYRYSGSNEANEVGWCTYFPWGPSAEKDPRPVAKLNPNELGIYDMSGNVWEWCQDWFADYPEEAQVNPTGPETGTKRVIRGGSCYNDNYESHCDVYNRAGVEPDKTVFGSNNEPIGIRLAMDLNETLYNRASDINNDGVVDISDVNAVINLMLGKQR
jgi:formylglycine-generating enzyme required for sulfatase activity